MSNKPFACKHDGCELTFANEDHLQVHQKRHEMVLNVGLANKNQAFADETPTPTRFIRNCEEVGLFQDLQNVNPFDETFQKAIDHSNNCSEPQFTANNSLDDTLHTPHIFPHIEASTKSSTSNDISSPICTDLDSDSHLDKSDRLIIIDSEDEEVDQIIVDINQSTLKSIARPEESDSFVEILHPVKDKFHTVEISKTSAEEKMSLKDKLRERLQTRNSGHINQIKERLVHNSEKYLPRPSYLPVDNKQTILTTTYNESLVVQKQQRKRRCTMSMSTNESIVSSSTTEIGSVDGIDPDDDDDDDALVSGNKNEDRKLRNRVAQSRSRLRKKIHYEVLNRQLRVLQCQTDELRTANKTLKKQIHELKKYILTHHEKCAFTGDMVFLKKCLRTEELIDKSTPKPVYPLITSKKRILLPAPSKGTPVLQPLRVQPSKKPIIVSVPPTKEPPKGNLNYIVISSPTT